MTKFHLLFSSFSLYFVSHKFKYSMDTVIATNLLLFYTEHILSYVMYSMNKILDGISRTLLR